MTVNYTMGGTARNGTDYEQVGTSVSIAAGASSVTITVTPKDDSQVEGDETVVLTIGAGAAYNVGSPSSATVVIADNDQPSPQNPTVTVMASDANASEEGPDTGAFTISRAGDTSGDLTVNYTLGGTARNGTDYEQLGTSATIAAGASSVTITVTPKDDSQVEGNETVVLTIGAGAAYNVGSPSSATVVIADNDQPPPEKPTVTVVASDANASEEGPDTGAFTISRAGDTSGDLTVNYTLCFNDPTATDIYTLSLPDALPTCASSVTITVTPKD